MNSLLPFQLPSPNGVDSTPVWTGSGFLVGQKLVPVLEYSENFAGWSDDLTLLHEEVAGDAHPIDVASRADALRQLKRHLGAIDSPVIMEIGCSSGFLLRDIANALPKSTLVGADVVKAPLYYLAEELPHVPLIRFDLLQCPLPNAAFDAIVLLNVLEHIEDDSLAMIQLFRLLKPGGVAIIEVPAGPKFYDGYDKALMHFRRYAMPDLVANLERVGFAIIRRSHLGFFVYQAFAFVKRRNQRFNTSEGNRVVTDQAKDTSSSLLMRAAMSAESFLGRLSSFPLGIRCLVTAKKAYQIVANIINVELRTFSFFAFFGIATAAVNFAFLALCLEILGVEYRIAVSSSYIIGVLFHFSMNKMITFNQNTLSGTRQQFFRYIVLVAINYVITLLIVMLAVEVFGLLPYHGVLLSMGATVITGYIISRSWVFKRVS